jgi:Carboxypeptidase regulatory-like domain
MPALVVYPPGMAALLAAALAGLFGTVVRSPTTPVCQVGNPCSAPAAGVTLTFSHDGKVVKSVVTTSAGKYHVQLAAGVYTVRFVSKSRIARLTPTTVTVRSGAVLRRDFTIDTGIR